MESSNDTDTLLALVSSLLTEKTPDADSILEALVHCNGNVEATAKLLNGSGDTMINTKKRKRADLAGWLAKSQKTTKDATRRPIVASSKPSSESSSSSHRPPAVNLMSTLRPPPSPKKSIQQLPPLLLSNPDMVAQNTPCTLHLSILPPELACRLFYTMVHASRDWKRNKWWLFDRLVESPHRTAFFARKDDGIDGNESWQEAAQFWYNGRVTDPPEVFPPVMEDACKIVERVVNEQLKTRHRFPLEWGSDEPDTNWRANVAASNCYEGSKESVGFHSDQLTYLGPYPTIASLSLVYERPSFHLGGLGFSDPEADNRNGGADPNSSNIVTIAQEPLTPLTKILLILALVLLLLTSVFIGLFAGVQHKLNLERGRHGGGDGEKPPPGTVTATFTTTSIVTSTETTTSTSTTTRTTTLAPPPGPTTLPKEEACLTPQCILLSGSILSSLDTSQDPCENFYDFATGGWLRAHPLPADKGSFGNFEALSQQNKQVVQRILENKSTPTTWTSAHDTEILRKLRDFYTSCVNEDVLNDIGTTPLLHFVQTLRSIYRGDASDADSADTDDQEKTDLTGSLAYLHSQGQIFETLDGLPNSRDPSSGIDALFSFDVEGDIGKDPNNMVLWFSQPSLSLPSKEYYKDQSVLKVYQNVVEQLLLTLSDEDDKEIQKTPVMVTNEDVKVWPPWPWPPWGEDGDDKDEDEKPVNKTRRAHRLAKMIVKLEKKLAKASLDLDILFQDPIATYNPIPLSNLTDALPQIDFPAYFSSFTPRTFPDTVIMTYPAYASSLGRILDETSSGVLEAYLVVRAALTLAPHLGTSTETWQAQRTLHELLNGIKKGAVGDRLEYCIGKVEESLGFAVGRYFVNETFGGDSRVQGTKVITDIVKSFKASLPHVDWMDKKSGDAAAEKANAIRVKVGFPILPDTRNSRSIARYYARVKVDSVNFFENAISAAKSDQFKKWLLLGRRRDPESWEMYPSMVNAYFNPPANEIVFPAGILQPPFFEAGWPSYISYGAFGHVAAHELIHAFDSAGRLYNQEGKLEEWWTNSTSEGFKVKQDCIVKQYSAYTVDDGKGGKIHVNGNLTSGENIGDTGLIQAYRAWNDQYEASYKAGNEYLLPGLTYTREQLFFISFARIWARAMKPAAAVQRIRTDPHSPSRYRVDGTVSNIPEFAKAFKCSKKAKLNPPAEAQCRFW
ncbi:hypothetical protein D9615_001643 [Tricholomella constricta]|uniref:Zincin n=1 Tax=Tricholomella constricta TaxID=117010 RepID=A0A8H5MAJ9_9AGAR|nr:hypothetical protein D9615_001643 [Tricholomella constricta]